MHRAHDCLKSDYEELKRQHLELIVRFQDNELRRLSHEALKYNLQRNLNKFNNNTTIHQGDIRKYSNTHNENLPLLCDG